MVGLALVGMPNLVALPASLGDLETLHNLFLHDLPALRSLPPEISKLDMVKLIGSDVGLTSPPLEIVNQGIDAIRNYFDSLEASDETVTLYEAKLLIVGRGEVGKTCLMNKLIDPDYAVSGDELTTEGVEIKRWNTRVPHPTGEVDFTLNLWDFGGQEIYHSTHQFFLTKRSLYIFVWDARKGEDQHSFDYWLNVVRLLSDGSPTVMVMNKADERVAEIEQKSIQTKFPNIVRFHQVSSLTNQGIDDLRADILRFAGGLPHIGDKLPRAWTEVRDAVSAMEESVISFDNFVEIAGQHGLNEEQALFLGDYFHDLGIFLHFTDEELLEDIVILKPEWGTNAVYNVLDDDTVKENFGRFTRKELAAIWEAYEKDKHPHLLRLMTKFELCFEMG